MLIYSTFLLQNPEFTLQQVVEQTFLPIVTINIEDSLTRGKLRGLHRKLIKKAKKEAKKAAKGIKSGTTTADASGAEEELDSEKRALYTKRAAEKGVPLETYIKRRQEKYAAKKDEKRK